MASTFQKVADMKTQTGELENILEKRKAEWEENKELLTQKYLDWKEQISDLGTVISSTEISNVRSAQIINSITEIAKSAKKKLAKNQERLKNILGDWVILATSVVYLGVFSMRKRIAFRRNLKDSLENFQINSSAEWNSEDSDTHWAIFKELWEENGIKKMMNKAANDESVSNIRACFVSSDFIQLFPEKENGEVEAKYSSDKISLNSVFWENIFQLIFSPTTPVCFDSTGLLSEFVKSVFASNNYTWELHDFRELHSHKINASASNDIQKLEEDKKLLSDSNGSINPTEIPKPTNSDVVCLHDMNIWMPENSFQKYSLKALKMHWTPIMHKLGWFTIPETPTMHNQSKKSLIL